MSSPNDSSAPLLDLPQPTGSISPVPPETQRTSSPALDHPVPGPEQRHPPSAMTQLSPSPVGSASLPTSRVADQARGEARSQRSDSAPTRTIVKHSTLMKAKPNIDAEQSRTNWPGLNLLLKTLDATAGVFSPLKVTIGSFTDLVEVFEVASTEHSGYEELRATLDTLLADIGQHIGGTTSPKMTASMGSLCTAINAELRTVEQKITRDPLRRHIEAIEDPNRVLECYRRLQGHLERFSMNADMSVWRTIDEIAREARLHRLSTAISAVYNSARSEEILRGPCTEGTRQEELAMLLDWARDKHGVEVYWMNGMAGTGKTTIAYSLCAELETTAKLGASFFCSRQIPECRDVKLIIPAIAYQLARFSFPFCCELMKVLEADPDVHNRVLKTQFERLLVNPLVAVKHTLPTDTIVVVDALDECENENSIGQILDVLLSQTSTSDLPVRFLVSSRPEPQIYSRMTAKIGANHEARLVLHELDAIRVKYDIEIYLKAELADVRLAPSQLHALASQCGVLFIYASTAARYIKGGIGYKQQEARLNMILGLALSSNNGKNQDIKKLYTSILESAFRKESLDQSDKVLMKAILDTVVCAQEPLTINGLSGMLGVQDIDRIEGLVGPLRSVLNVGETSRLVTTLHASFPDYMRNYDHENPAPFSCDAQITHAQIARACFSLITASAIVFNTCTLESSYLRDEQVSDLSERASQAISEQLFYACRYWMTHLELNGERDNLRDLMYRFLSERLLLWMELLNLKKSMHLGPKIMRHAGSWSRVHKCSETMIDLAHDAWRFVTTFASHVVSQSTPHIYVSMLPFWPRSAPIATHYMANQRRAIQVEGSAMTRRQLALLATWPLASDVWSVCLSPDESLLACAVGSSVFIIDGTTGRIVLGPLAHNERVKDVTFSNDGARLVSCSFDRTLKVWGIDNGQLVLEPLAGHTDYVNSVALFPDGDRVVSGSRDGTIRVWSLESGRTVLGPLNGQDGGVWSVCVSSSGTRIASGHSNGIIRIWDAEHGQISQSQLLGHTGTVESVCFSPDDTCLVSGSRDSVIRLWNNLTGQVTVNKLEGHTNTVGSVAFSPDGTYVASGSDDFTVRLWNVEGKPQLVQVFTGHTNNVWCVRVSSDGARIFSTSSDRTIRVWDARTQAPANSTLQGHTQVVTSVTFSPDATQILSGSNDGMIYIWDAHTGQIAVGPMTGHTHWVNSVCFSPDQSRIASGSEDNTIRLWDAYSGQAVGEPLTGHSGRVFSVCFSPDGSLIASCSEDTTVRLWDAQSGEPVGSPLKAHTSWVRSVCFSPDSLRVASGSSDKVILVWDANTGQPALPPLKGHTDTIWAVCVSPDGTRIASGSRDTTIRLWDTSSGHSVFGPLLGHTAGINSVCFSPDGSYIVSGSDDKTIRLWDARSGQEVGNPLIGHTHKVRSVGFSPNGGQVVSGSRDLSIRVWDIIDLVRVKGSQGDPDQGVQSSHGYQSWLLQEDGWVIDCKSRLIAWVPLDLHAGLMNPRNPLLISTKGAMQLEIDSSKLGASWTECYNP